MSEKRKINRFLCLLSTALLTTGAVAQPADYPSRPITIINPWTAGGNIDLVARAVAQSMQKQTGKSFIIENAPGAGSMIGTTRAAGAKPDGYTVLWGSSSGFVILPHINSNVRYDPVKSFEPIGWIGSSPYVLVVSSDSPYKTLRDLINQAKANPGKLAYGTPGTGSSPHVTNEAILSAVQAKALHVPFKSSQDMVNAVLRRDADWIIDFASAVMPMVKAGRFRALAVTGAKRTPAMPDLPALREDAELGGFEALSWMGLFAPKGVAAEPVRALNRYLSAALKEPEVINVMASVGFTAEPGTPAELGDSVKREYEKWGEIIRRHNIRLE